MKYLEKVFNIIGIVAYSDIEGVSVIEVSEKAGLPMSSTHRILNDLVECEALVKNLESRKYRLSPRIVPLVHEISRKMNLDLLKVILTELKDEINETVFLSELMENGVAALLTVESNRVFSFRARSGVYLPVHCTASGLAIVAHIESSKAERLMCISSGNKDSQVSQCPLEKFRDRLAKVRRDGFAFCNEEYEPGLRALAVPVLRPNGFAFASITAIAPGERFSDEEGNRQVVERMKEAAVKVGKFMY